VLDLYGYSPSCITTMIDTPANVESDSHLLPTRENIITELQELVKDAEPGDRFFFFFAGHSTREPTEPMDEEDGMDELIVTYDNLLIKDDELREMLVKPLPPGVNLTAVFDSCHGADLL
ncbi:peptidase C14, caspase domain-containing protein, partial [Coprinopsis sp. MPI-PUGE-AT-0042]